MHIVELVHRLDCERGLGNVEARLLLGEHIVLHQNGHQVAALQVLHDQVQVEVVLYARGVCVRDSISGCEIELERERTEKER